MSPTSSRKIVPRSACSNLPICFSVAPVNEPFSWPKSSLSISSSGMAAQFTCTKRSSLAQAVAVDGARHQLLADAALARDEHGGVGRRRAPHRVPAPSRSAALSPTIWYRSSTLFLQRGGSRRAGASGRARCAATSRTRSLSSGFSMKSNAPELGRLDRGLDGAVAGEDHDGQRAVAAPCSRFSTSMPSIRGILMSRSTRSGASRSAIASAACAVRGAAGTRSPRTRGSSAARRGSPPRRR